MTTEPTPSGAARAHAGRSRILRALVTLPFALTVAAAGCAPARSPADQAADMERAQCAPDVPEGSLAPMVGPSAVESVEPLYDVRRVPAQGGGRTDAAEEDFGHREDAGAVIHLRNVGGVTAEWLDRALQCHEARLMLGRIPEIANDPFSLPGGMVAIEVQPAQGNSGFRVTARGHNQDDAHAILARARAYAQAPR